MLGLVIASIFACGSKPKECDALPPLVAEIKAALSQFDLAGVQAPGEKLVDALREHRYGVAAGERRENGPEAGTRPPLAR